jgi:hypothetical protein
VRTYLRPLVDELYARTRSLGGESGEIVAKVPFTFATPSPLVLQAVLPGNVLDRVSVLIQTPFNDPTATIQVGTTTDPDLVFVPGAIVLFGPLSGLTYEDLSLYEFTMSDLLILTISSGASTMGAGLLLYKMKL